MKPVEFECPRGKGKHNAFLYSSGRAGCPIHGWLLYTEIPESAYEKANLNHQELHKSKGWKTVSDLKIPRIFTIGVDSTSGGGKRIISIKVFGFCIKIPRGLYV